MSVCGTIVVYVFPNKRLVKQNCTWEMRTAAKGAGKPVSTKYIVDIEC